MADAWPKLRDRAHDAVGTLHELLGDPATDDRRLIAGYLQAKRELAEGFEALLVSRYVDRSVIAEAKLAIEAEMRRAYPQRRPSTRRSAGTAKLTQGCSHTSSEWQASPCRQTSCGC